MNCAYCGHRFQRHRSGQSCLDCVADKDGHLCYHPIKEMSREEVQKALEIKTEVLSIGRKEMA